MTYAARYPEQVAGLVLLDSSSPYQLTKVAAYPGQYAVMRRGLALLPTLARLGVSRLAPAPHLPAPAGAQVQALTSTAKAARNGRDELSVAPRRLRPGSGTDHARQPTARGAHHLRVPHRSRLGRRPGPAGGTLDQPRPPHRGLHPRRDSSRTRRPQPSRSAPSPRSSPRSAPAPPWSRSDHTPTRQRPRPNKPHPNPRSSDVTHHPPRTSGPPAPVAAAADANHHSQHPAPHDEQPTRTAAPRSPGRCWQSPSPPRSWSSSTSRSSTPRCPPSAARCTSRAASCSGWSPPT